MSLFEVSFFTHPDRFYHLQNTLEYQRIGAVSVGGKQFRLPAQETVSEKTLQLPTPMTRKLVAGMYFAERAFYHPANADNSLRINCHLFARLMAGMEQNLDAPFWSVEGERVIGNLHAGLPSEPGLLRSR